MYLRLNKFFLNSAGFDPDSFDIRVQHTNHSATEAFV